MDRAILVTDVNRGSGLTILRSLGRRGWQIVAASTDPQAIGFHSKYTTHRLIYPAPEEEPQNFIDSVLDAVRKHNVELIIPVTDEAILPLSQNRAEFSGLCQIAMPDKAQLELVTNKFKTLELAKEQGVPIPRTHMLKTAAEAEAFCNELHWPVVLKPISSRLYDPEQGISAFKVSYAKDGEDLCRQMRGYEGICDILLQEYHVGEGHGVELLMWQGQTVSAFQHRRLHEVPISGGASALRESVPLDPLLYSYATRLLSAIQWSGLAMVEFKVSKQAAYLMEINGRVWGSLPLSVYSGMDFPSQLADLYLNEESIPEAVNENYRIGVRARNLSLDVVWLFSVLRGRKINPLVKTPSRWQLFSASLGYLNPSIKYDVQTWDDPLPGLLELPQIASKLLRKLN